MYEKKYTYVWQLKPYKSDKGISRIEIAPSDARPLTNGSWDNKQISNNVDGNAFLPRPIKHWRKQLNVDPIRGGSKSKNIIEVSQPGGTIYLNAPINEERECCDENGITTKIVSYIDIEKNNKNCNNASNCSYAVTDQDVANGWNGPIGKKICCNPEKNIIKRATTLLSKKYYTDTKGYLRSRNKLYDQKLTNLPYPGVTYYNSEGEWLYPNNSPLGPQVFSTGECPPSACGGNQQMTIFKPNNRQFKVQGAVSSSTRLDKLKLDTVKKSGKSLTNAYGKSAAQAGSYYLNGTTPYLIKDKIGKCENHHRNGNLKSCNITYRPYITGTFIYEFNNNSRNFISNIPIPIISTNSLFYDYNTEIIGSITRVTVNYTFYTDDTSTNDGLSFLTTDDSTINFYNAKLGNLTIIDFGNIPLSKGGDQFRGLINLVFDTNAGDPTMPFFGTSLQNCFSGCTNFNSNLNSWNTGNVTNMNSMFRSAFLFDQNIGSWNVSSVTNMNTLFVNAVIFNNGGSSDISGWYAPNCTSFFSMFISCLKFNQPLTNLVDTTTVSTCSMSQMFRNAIVFNQDIGSWKVDNVNSMLRMFRDAASFNQNIGSWNVDNVTNMLEMFQNASAFNNGGSPDIQNWSAPLCTTFTSMFNGASAFNQPLTNLVNTSGLISPSVCAMNSMFSGANLFNQNVSDWNVSKASPMNSMFQSAIAFNNGETGRVYISGNMASASYTNATSILSLPEALFNSQLTTNDVLIITTPTIIYTSQIQRIISDASLVLLTPYGANITSGITSVTKQVAGSAPLNWDTTNVTNMASMFAAAFYFNQNISNWSTSNVTNMSLMFQGASTGSALKHTFNNGQLAGSSGQSLNWSAPLCSEFNSMFQNTSGFNQAIPYLVGVPPPSTTNIPGCILANLSYTTSNSSLTSTNAIFSSPAINNRTLIITTSSSITYVSVANYVNTTNVTLVTNFGSNINQGEIISIYIGPTMLSMFSGASVFNQNVNTWKTDNVTNLTSTFTSARVFNNGQSVTVSVTGTASLANYTNSSRTLTCPDALFTLDFSPNDGIIITKGGLAIYSSVVNAVIDDTTLTVSILYPVGNTTTTGANINVGDIISIQKQVVGTTPDFDLSWNTQNVTTTANMFQNAYYFNQRLPWNMRKNVNVTSMFAGTANTFINLFNNGQIITGTTQKLYPGGAVNTWDFSGNTIIGSPTTTNGWRVNSRLLSGAGNGVTTNPVFF